MNKLLISTWIEAIVLHFELTLQVLSKALNLELNKNKVSNPSGTKGMMQVSTQLAIETESQDKACGS